MLKPASAGIAPAKTDAKVTATIEMGMSAGLEPRSCETQITETKGQPMKLETRKTSMIRIQVKALAFVAVAWLAYAFGSGLA